MKNITIDIDAFIKDHNELKFESDKEKERVNDSLCESFSQSGVEIRFCSVCNNLMETGYVLGNGEYYFCSDECKLKEVTEEEWVDLATNHSDYNYWTEWN